MPLRGFARRLILAMCNSLMQGPFILGMYFAYSRGCFEIFSYVVNLLKKYCFKFQLIVLYAVLCSEMTS